jgi:hypothetical protein
MVEIYGTHSWRVIAEVMPGRNVRQCRERWKHYLSCEKPNEPWSPEEDRLLAEKIARLGPRWTKLAAFFPGRTDIQVKAHWLARFSAPTFGSSPGRQKFPLLVPPERFMGSLFGFGKNDAIEDVKLAIPIALQEPAGRFEGPLSSKVPQI